MLLCRYLTILIFLSCAITSSAQQLQKDYDYDSICQALIVDLYNYSLTGAIEYYSDIGFKYGPEVWSKYFDFAISFADDAALVMKMVPIKGVSKIGRGAKYLADAYYFMRYSDEYIKSDNKDDTLVEIVLDSIPVFGTAFEYYKYNESKINYDKELMRIIANRILFNFTNATYLEKYLLCHYFSSKVSPENKHSYIRIIQALLIWKSEIDVYRDINKLEEKTGCSNFNVDSIIKAIPSKYLLAYNLKFNYESFYRYFKIVLNKNIDIAARATLVKYEWDQHKW